MRHWQVQIETKVVIFVVMFLVRMNILFVMETKIHVVC
jgi:hypothetical protein